MICLPNLSRFLRFGLGCLNLFTMLALMGTLSSLQAEDSIGGGSLTISPSQPSKSWSTPRDLYPDESVSLSVKIEPTGNSNQKNYKLQGTPFPAFLGGATLWTQTSGGGNNFSFKALNAGGQPQSQTVKVVATWTEVDNPVVSEAILGEGAGGAGTERKLDSITGSASGSASSDRPTFTWELGPRLQFADGQSAIHFSVGGAASGAMINLAKYTIASDQGWGLQSDVASPGNQVDGTIKSASPGKGVLKVLFNGIEQGRSGTEVAFAELDLAIAKFGNEANLLEDRIATGGTAAAPHEMNPGSVVVVPNIGSGGSGSRSKLTLTGNGGTPKEGTFTLKAENLANMAIYESATGGDPVSLPRVWNASDFPGTVTLYVGGTPSSVGAQDCTLTLVYKRPLPTGAGNFEIADSVRVRPLPIELDLAIAKFSGAANLAEDRTPSGDTASVPHEMDPGSAVIAPIAGSSETGSRSMLTLKGNGQTQGEGSFTLKAENLANVAIYESSTGGIPISLPRVWNASDFPGSVTLYVGANPIAVGAAAQDGTLSFSYKHPLQTGAGIFEIEDSVRVRLQPIEIVVHKKDEAPPADGMLAKVGDTLIYKIIDDPKSFPIPASVVTWQRKRLKGSGSFDAWTPLAGGTGPRAEVVEGGAGIFQIRAKIVTGGSTLYYSYKRKKDDPHGKDSFGNMNPILKSGAPDYVGIAAGQRQLHFTKVARGALGSTAFAELATVPVSATFTALPGEPKCNIFVYHMAIASGATVPLDAGGSPPRAFNWWDSLFPIAGWFHYNQTWWVEPGVVVARPSVNWWIIQDLLERGHVGILDYDGSWINAGPRKVNRFPHITSKAYQTANFRKN